MPHKYGANGGMKMPRKMKTTSMVGHMGDRPRGGQDKGNPLADAVRMGSAKKSKPRKY